jgi:hypothetical protein
MNPLLSVIVPFPVGISRESTEGLRELVDMPLTSPQYRLLKRKVSLESSPAVVEDFDAWIASLRRSASLD